MRILTYFFAMLLLSSGGTLLAQSPAFPWPEADLGSSLIIEPGPPGTVNNTINGDTTAAGVRNHQVYILRRGATYLYTNEVNNVGYPLMVKAEEGTGPLPVLIALAPTDGSEASRPFLAQGDLYLENIKMNGFDNTDFPTDNATVRLAADSITVVLRGCTFDFNRQNAIRINSPQCSLYVESCILGSQGQAFDPFQGFGISFRGVFSQLVHVRNSTFYNNYRAINLVQGEKRYNTFIFENNTLVNTGLDAFDFGRPDRLVFKNNLAVNMGILGNGWQGDRDNFAEEWWIFRLDSNVVVLDTTTNETEYIAPEVEFTHNHIYMDPGVSAFLPDSSDSPLDSMLYFDEELSDFIAGDPSNQVIGETFPFTNFPNPTAELGQFIVDYYNTEPDPAQLPSDEVDITTLDFSYPTTHPAYTAGTFGRPIGDLTWFDMTDVVSNDVAPSFEVKVFPNPAQTHVEVDMERLSEVILYNVKGQQVRSWTGLNGATTLDISTLESGMYLLQLTNPRGDFVTRRLVKE